MAMQEDMEKATKAVGENMKKQDAAQDNKICTCPECGYQGSSAEFEESEPMEEESAEPKAGMEVEIAVGKPKLMSAREAAMRAFKGK